ncbi:GNAT family N-acetyltransferase [Amycolatopsis endophytica]|uniref:Ribosomal protein S18 acetylase RimI-like enzyme n=1 Tax=Amycolatopsis endophytica TaxID=860233 RepID=A0A853BFL8_9PSEU|nr:GNAT family N-acetyltransferase [Amycolatopsis endophytica]NYI93545.1 ribosomal protein S18 acetylase RimI-like enzyme [Amycolatopsis endophytica]
MITRLSAADYPGAVRALGEVLADCTNGGASVGFLAPFDPAEAAAWWKGLAGDVESGALLIWAAWSGARLVGTVQIRRSSMPNAPHRGELAKLLVHRDARGRGLGRTLLAEAERGARDAGITVLVLDTETGSPAQRLYSSAGWTETGTIPDYAQDPSGALRSTTFFYKKALVTER